MANRTLQSSARRLAMMLPEAPRPTTMKSYVFSSVWPAAGTPCIGMARQAVAISASAAAASTWLFSSRCILGIKLLSIIIITTPSSFFLCIHLTMFFFFFALSLCVFVICFVIRLLVGTCRQMLEKATILDGGFGLEASWLQSRRTG